METTMKFYTLPIIVTLLFSTMQADVFWSKLSDTISSKIKNSRELVIHKEFSTAQRLEINNEHGNIIINSWKQKTIAIEAIINRNETAAKNVTVDIESIDEVIKILTKFSDPKLKATVNFNILLPTDIAIKIITKSGDIVIKDVNNSLDIQTSSGDIKLANLHNNITAITKSGNIFFRTLEIENGKEVELITNKGNIEFCTIPNINCNLNASALQGKVISDIPITLDSKTTLLNQESWNKHKQVVDGRIGQSDSQVTIIADHGTISIMSYIKQNDIF